MRSDNHVGFPSETARSTTVWYSELLRALPWSDLKNVFGFASKTGGNVAAPSLPPRIENHPDPFLGRRAGLAGMVEVTAVQGRRTPRSTLAYGYVEFSLLSSSLEPAVSSSCRSSSGTAREPAECVAGRARLPTRLHVLEGITSCYPWSETLYGDGPKGGCGAGQ